MATSREQEAAFVGRVTAGATHEFRNVLAIVRESAGLIEDLVGACEQGNVPDRAALLRAVARIEAQVCRGAELAGALNGLAHALEGSDGAVDLVREVERAARLSERFVRRRERQLRIRAGVVSVAVAVAPLPLLMAIVAAVDLCVGQVPAGGSVVVAVEETEAGPSVVFGGERPDGSAHALNPEGAGSASLLELIGEMGGGVESARDVAGFRIVLPEGSAG